MSKCLFSSSYRRRKLQLRLGDGTGMGYPNCLHQIPTRILLHLRKGKPSGVETAGKSNLSCLLFVWMV